MHGWSTSPKAIPGLCVTTVIRKSGGKNVISSEVVVPPSMITTCPGEMSCAPRRATRFFASILTD